MMVEAAKLPAVQHAAVSLPLMKAARKPPTKASPAPLVSTISDEATAGTSYLVTAPSLATIVESLPCVMTCSHDVGHSMRLSPARIRPLQMLHTLQKSKKERPCRRESNASSSVRVTRDLSKTAEGAVGLGQHAQGRWGVSVGTIGCDVSDVGCVYVRAAVVPPVQS